MIPGERLTRQNREQGRGEEKKIRLHTAIVCLADARALDTRGSSACGGALLGAVSDVSIASCQSRSHDRSHSNTHFPRLLVIS